MSVTSTDVTISYTGNGSAVTPYPVPFRVLKATDLILEQRTNLEPDAAWTEIIDGLDVTLDEETGFASARTFQAWDNENELRISRVVDLLQEAEYPVAGAFPAESHERALDKLAMVDQQLAYRFEIHNHDTRYYTQAQIDTMITNLATQPLYFDFSFDSTQFGFDSQ